MNQYSLKIFLVCLLASLSACANAAAAGDKKSKNTRIVGGRLATIGEVPYLMQFRVWKQFFCGGTLVTPTIVVSAAHCLKATDPKNMVVVGGASTITEAGVQRKIVAYMAHPRYDIRKSGSTHDIVIYQLDSPMSGTNIATRPLCTKQIKAGDKIQVSGWGHTSEKNSTTSNKVRTMHVSTFNRGECTQRYRGSTISETMFCASNLGKEDACQGDSGGPAIYNGELCGVVSWGSGCASDYYPGIYTDVLLLSKWIQEAINNPKGGGWISVKRDESSRTE